MLPPSLSAPIDDLLAGVRPSALQDAVASLSARYRSADTVAAPIRTRLDALAYVAYRMPATYAVVRAVFREIRDRRPDWEPETVLDAGAGPGTATLAALDEWAGIASVDLVEPSPHMREVGRHLEAAVEHPSSRRWHSVRVDELDGFKADLVIASYVLGEGGDAIAAAGRLWSAARDTLVVIEPGTPRGFGTIRAVREALVGGGAGILAPCTHVLPCPMPDGDWCHFAHRVARTRLHRHAKGADAPFEDEKYSYIVLTRGGGAPGGHRVVRPVRARSGFVSLTTCSEAGIVPLEVSRRDTDVYPVARRLRWGGRLPTSPAAPRRSP